MLFLRGFLPFRAFVLRMWVYARASCSCSSSSHKSSWAHPRRGTWPDFVFVFVVVFMSRTKIGPPKSPKIFIYDPVLYAKTQQDEMYIRQPVFSHLLWFQSCRCLVLSLHIYFFLTLLNLHAMYVSLVNLFKLPVLSDQLLYDVLSVWVCHALVLPSVQSGPCAHKAMTVSCP